MDYNSSKYMNIYSYVCWDTASALPKSCNQGGIFMNMLQIFAIIILLIFYGVSMIKLIAQRRKGIQTIQLGIGSKDKKTLLVEKLLKFAFILIALIELASILLNTNSFFPGNIRIVGLALTFTGTLVFIIAMLTMRDSWRAGIPAKDKTEIVTSGIYSISRNPAFFGFDLTYIGFYLAFDNLLLLVATLFVITIIHLQILEEEKFLTYRFGEKYLEYKKRVGRYLKLSPFRL